MTLLGGGWVWVLVGAGVKRYANGNVYDGEWKDDKRNGRGGVWFFLT